MEEQALFVYISCGSMKEARKIASYCVSNKMAACGNILPQMESVYSWDNDIHHEQEVVLILKTHPKRYEDIEKAIRSLHSYECPCITALPVTHGFAPYLDWIKENSSV